MIISIVLRPINVSSIFGNVISNWLNILFILGKINSLLYNVCSKFFNTKISSLKISGILINLLFIVLIILIMGLINVLFVKISIVDLPINVSLIVGKINSPILIILLIMGLTNVLLYLKDFVDYEDRSWY